MERMGALKWQDGVDYRTGDVNYYLHLRGTDRENRDYLYRGAIRKQVFVSPKGSTKNSYYAEYSLTEDGKNFSLRSEKGNCEFTTLQEAKKWVEAAFRDKWRRDHQV